MLAAHDIAAYVLKKHGPMTAMKLQKLVYYAQAWSLVWDDEPLFGDKIEAWANGPVVRSLYAEHAGKYTITSWPKGDPDRLTKKQRATVDAVMEAYASRTSQWLSDLTHAEAPWRDARVGLGPSERGKAEISHAAMAEYYSTLSRTNARALR